MAGAYGVNINLKIGSREQGEQGKQGRETTTIEYNLVRPLTTDN